MAGKNGESTSIGASPPKRTAGFTVPRKSLAALAAVVLLLVAYNLMVSAMAERADAYAERIPGRNLLPGAQPRTLGPEDASAAILFVHGFVGVGDNFADLPDRLAKLGMRVRVMLLPGHGTSPSDFAKTKAEELIAAVRNELSALRANHHKVFLAGHSMGGAIGTLVSSTEQVDGLILGAPYFGVTFHWFYVLPPETWTDLTSHIVRWVYKGDAFVRVKDKSVRQFITSYKWIPAEGSRTLVKLGRMAKDPKLLARVTCPVLVIHATGDQAASPEASATALDNMASENKKYIQLQNSDHHIFWDYDREQVAEEITAFLEEQGGIPPAT